MVKYRRYFSGVWNAVVMLFYGLHLFFNFTYIRLLEPPERFFLGVACVLIGFVYLVSVVANLPLKRISYIAQFCVWLVVAYLYGVNPVLSIGWLFAIAMAGHSLLGLLRGDFDGEY